MIGKITFLSGIKKNKFLLFNNILTIGRNPVNDLQIAHPSISREHAKISVKNGSFSIKDLKSNNGTFVNDKIVSGNKELGTGDIIRISNIEMRFEMVKENEVDKAALKKIFIDYAQSPKSTATGYLNIEDANLQSLYKKIKNNKNI